MPDDIAVDDTSAGAGKLGETLLQLMRDGGFSVVPLYALFAGQSFYPGGGWNDFVKYGSDICYLIPPWDAEKKQWIEPLANATDTVHPPDWWSIVDMSTGKEVVRGKPNGAIVYKSGRVIDRTET